jgi:hypothetical protein
VTAPAPLLPRSRVLLLSTTGRGLFACDVKTSRSIPASQPRLQRPCAALPQCQPAASVLSRGNINLAGAAASCYYVAAVIRCRIAVTGAELCRVATLVCPARSINFNFSVLFSCGSTTLCSRSSFQKLRSGRPGSAKLWASPFHTTMWRNSLLVLCFRRRATVKRARRLEF